MSAGVQRGWPAVVDTVLIAGLALLALVPLAPVFDDGRFWLAVLGGVLLGTVAAVLGARLRAGVLEVTGFSIVGYFLFGGVFALRESAIAGVVPSVETLRDLALNVVFGWKNLLTVSVPVSGFDQLFAVPYLAGLIGSVLAVSFALRRRGLALLPVACLLIFAIAFGDSSGLLPALVGGVLGGIGLGWETWRRKRDRASLVLAASGSAEARRARLRQVSLGTAALLLAGAVGTGAAAAASGSWDRSTLREQVVPPLEVHAYASPLMSFRKFIEDGEDSTLFTVSGLPAGAVIRIASLDLYDGIVYKVSGGGGAASGVFARVGRDIPGEAAGVAATVRVRIQDLRGVWLPAAGNLAGIEFGGPCADDLTAGMHYNRATSTAVQTAGVAEGDTYTLDARIPVPPSSGELNQATLAQLATPVPEMIPDAIADRLNEAVTGTESPIKQVQAIQDYLTSKGYVSHGLEGDVASRPGHTFERLSAMLNNQQMIGDDEQYAVVMALMLAQAALPARVVMGFAPEQTSPGAEIAVTGADVKAWVEVPLEGYGWVAFHPTPEQEPQEQTPQARDKPRVQVPQPPIPPQEPAELPPQPPEAEEGEEAPGPDYLWLWQVLSISSIVLAVLALILGPGLVMLWLKARRRAKRRAAVQLPDRVSGAWSEIVDAATDLGTPVTAAATRRENAAELDGHYPALALPSLAAKADGAVFGFGEPAAADVDAYWADVETVRQRLEAQAKLKQRLRRFFAPASILGRWRWGR